jgi:DUF4097 and DUF4098 domain-containing protein YvlB
MMNSQIEMLRTRTPQSRRFAAILLRSGGLLGLSLFLFLSTACALGNGAYTAKRVDSWEFPATDTTALAIDNVNGDVRIEAVDGARKIKVTATVLAKNPDDLARLSVKVEKKGHRIELSRHASKKGWFGRSPDGRIDFEVSAPPGLAIDSIDTVNGDVTVIGNTNQVKVNTVNGNVRMQELAGSASVDVVNGDTQLQLSRLGSGQTIAVDTVNGDVELRLPADASARINTSTVSGDFQATGFPVNKSGGLVGKAVEATIGSGEARIVLDTVNGDMAVIRQ